ncbi:MAG: hypothetical protein NTX56_02790 [Proteobacteria bacterium]|nr:hypothetical protein [Pseudomonadota bacterium]
MLGLNQLIGFDVGGGFVPPGACATWNPADSNSRITLSGGDLIATNAYGGGDWYSVRATQGKTSGKWYWEIVCTTSNNNRVVGVGRATATIANFTFCGTDTAGYGYMYEGNFYNYNTPAAYGDTYSAGDVIGVALDCDNHQVNFAKNNTWFGINTVPAVALYPMLSMVKGSYDVVSTANFGASPLIYLPPVGFNPGLYT